MEPNNKKPERQVEDTPFHCELGHRVKSYPIGQTIGSQMLCPLCDREYVLEWAKNRGQ